MRVKVDGSYGAVGRWRRSCGFLSVERFVFEDGDVAVWVEAVDEAGAWCHTGATRFGMHLPLLCVQQF